jgi:hypothetical protein
MKNISADPIESALGRMLNFVGAAKCLPTVLEPARVDTAFNLNAFCIFVLRIEVRVHAQSANQNTPEKKLRHERV